MNGSAGIPKLAQRVEDFRPPGATGVQRNAAARAAVSQNPDNWFQCVVGNRHEQSSCALGQFGVSDGNDPAADELRRRSGMRGVAAGDACHVLAEVAQ